MTKRNVKIDPKIFNSVPNLAIAPSFKRLPKGKTDIERVVTSFLTLAHDKKRFGQYFIQNHMLYYVSFNEGNVTKTPIAHRMMRNRTWTFVGNSATLRELSRAFGRQTRSRGQSKIQELLQSHIPMVPFNVMSEAGLDIETYETIEAGPAETVKEKVVKYKNGKAEVTFEDRHFIGAQLFKVDSSLFLMDYDRNELKHGLLNAFLVKLPKPVKTIAEAYQSLKPIEVMEAEKKGLTVHRQGEWFFIPVKSAPIKGQQVFDASKSKDRWKREQLELQAGNNSPNYADKGFVHNKTGVAYVTGKISHSGREHRDLILKGWYIAIPNTATESFTIVGDID